MNHLKGPTARMKTTLRSAWVAPALSVQGQPWLAALVYRGVFRKARSSSSAAISPATRSTCRRF